jgi:hypothetical protein
MAFVLRPHGRRTQPEGLRQHSLSGADLSAGRHAGRQRPGFAGPTTKCSLKGCDTRDCPSPSGWCVIGVCDWWEYLLPRALPWAMLSQPFGLCSPASRLKNNRHLTGFLHSPQRGEVCGWAFLIADRSAKYPHLSPFCSPPLTLVRSLPIVGLPTGRQTDLVSLRGFA